MNRFVRLLALALVPVLLIGGCAAFPDPAIPDAGQTPALHTPSSPTPGPAVLSTTEPEALFTPVPAALPAAAPSPPEQTPERASFGFAGDVLMMTSQIEAARTANGYDFTPSFLPMKGLFEAVDVMVLNFEGTFAGADAGYTKPRETAPPATDGNPNPKRPMQRFNAPDALAKDLFSLGVDVLTTANNHCLDKGFDGLLRTAEVIRRAGLSQTGTFTSADDRTLPRCVIEVNDICVGLVAATKYLNGNSGKLHEREWAVCRLDDKKALREDIASCRAAGAEFIIVLPHWGDEYENRESSSQRREAKMLIELGADAIIGAHPHVVQPIEWIEAEREGETVRVPVVYSLGNFISNMAPSPKDYGMYVRLDLARGADGKVGISGLSYLPVYCIKQDTQRGRIHQALPCYEDPSLVEAFEPLDADERSNLMKCREHVVGIVGTDEAERIG